MKIFHFSCMLVIDFTVSWLLKYAVLLLMVKIMLKTIKKFVFLHMKFCNENLLELPVQYIYQLHVITVCFTNKGVYCTFQVFNVRYP